MCLSGNEEKIFMNKVWFVSTLGVGNTLCVVSGAPPHVNPERKPLHFSAFWGFSFMHKIKLKYFEEKVPML